MFFSPYKDVITFDIFVCPNYDVGVYEIFCFIVFHSHQMENIHQINNEKI